MKLVPAALVLCALAAHAAAQDASPPAAARASLELVAAKGDPKALASAMARRGGDWFDVVLSVVAEPMPALGPTKAVVAGLPEPEKKGVGGVLDAFAAASPQARQDFANATGALLATLRTFGDPKADAKAVADAATLAEERVKAANHPWTTARGAAAKAIGKFDESIAPLEPELGAAVEALAALGDRFGAGLAAAFHAKALADANDFEKAVAARERAQADLKAIAALDKGAPHVRALLARIDLALAGPLFTDARDDAAAACCARARAHFKTSDPLRDLEAAAIEASIAIDRGNPAAAVEATKPHLVRVPQIRDRTVLVRFSMAVATALRMTGKSPAAIEFLRKALARAKELGLTPNEESPMRAAAALAYLQSGQNEPAHAAFEVAAKFADEPALRAFAKSALLNRALLLKTQDRDEEAGKTLERAAATSLGGPILDRVVSAGPFLNFAELLVDKGKPKEALKFIRDAALVAEELGLRLEEVRLAATTAVKSEGTPLHLRLGAALGSYESGPDWAGFEPVFLVTERRLQEVLARGAPEEKPPADMLERLRESDRQVLLLRRAISGARAPISEEEARRIVAFRQVMMDEASSRTPTYALRQFPRAGSIKRARDNYCGPDGAVYGASVTAEGAYAFAFSRDRFVFSAVPIVTRITDAVAAFASIAKDASASPAAWIAASAPVWEHLVQKQLVVFEDKKWVAVCPDPTIDDVPIEALVAPDAKSESFRTLPYLIQKIPMGRLPTCGLVTTQRNARIQSWVPDPFVGVVSKDDPAAGLALAQAFDPRVTAVAPRTERAGLMKLGDLAPGRAESAPEGGRQDRRARFLVFGPGIADHAVTWGPPTPALVCLMDPPASKEGSNNVFRWLIRGVRGVIAPSGPIERPVADAIMLATLRSFGQDGGNPIEALTVGKRAFLAASGKAAPPGVTEAHYHPAHWSKMQAWLVIP
jgi:tetratricopeptide (TPR) repeat protein